MQLALNPALDAAQLVAASSMRWRRRPSPPPAMPLRSLKARRGGSRHWSLWCGLARRVCAKSVDALVFRFAHPARGRCWPAGTSLGWPASTTSMRCSPSSTFEADQARIRSSARAEAGDRGDPGWRLSGLSLRPARTRPRCRGRRPALHRPRTLRAVVLLRRRPRVRVRALHVAEPGGAGIGIVHVRHQVVDLLDVPWMPSRPAADWRSRGHRRRGR